ncbi:MAG: PAS domain S-box protein [FCB group bacterium]|nr:PAS domain S-box protein [FCB group bacterium]
MKKVVNRYETEIRLGLVAIVVLLLLLNLSTSFVLNRVKRQLTARIDQQLALGIRYTSIRLSKEGSETLSANQVRFIGQKHNLRDIQVLPLAELETDSVPARLEIPRLDKSAYQRLIVGERIFCSGNDQNERFGFGLYSTLPGKRWVIFCRADSQDLATIAAAMKTTLYLAAAIMLLIVPLTIFLPRFILRPFKKMRETARTAGRLKESSDGDEVAGVIRSYRQIIEELKRNELELKRLYRESSSKANRLEKFNRYILESIGSGVITVDLAGKVIGYNRAAREILSYDNNMILGHHYLTALPQEVPLCLLIEAGLERSETIGHREIELQREDNTIIWLGAAGSLIYDDYNRTLGMTILFTDLTELKKLQNELELNRRMASLGEMTGGLAHQLRNSLAAVSGFSQLLQKKAGTETALADIAGSIRTETATSEAMLNRFLNFARPLHLNNEEVDLIDLVEQSINRVAREAEKRNISLNFDSRLESCLCNGDSLLLKEMFGNLIDNALQAVSSYGQIDMSLEVAGNTIVVVISDDGPGIDEGLREQIFTPFFSSRPSGTGLGLALAQKIVGLHQGRISFDRKTGPGAICRIVLPAINYKKITSEITCLAEAKKG